MSKHARNDLITRIATSQGSFDDLLGLLEQRLKDSITFDDRVLFSTMRQIATGALIARG